MTTGDRIRERRVSLGISQADLAKRMGYSSKSAVSRTENAGNNIGQKRVKAFAEALDTSPEALMGWSIKEEPVLLALDESFQKYLALPDEAKKRVDSLIELLYKKEVG